MQLCNLYNSITHLIINRSTNPKFIMGLSVGLVSVLAAVGACGAIFLVPLPEYMIWLAAFIVFIGLLGAIIYMQWEQSLPNQWLLLIENGKLVKAGIGLKCFVWPT